MLLIKPGWLPASVGVSMATGAITVYVIAVLKDDVTPYVPYISEAGAKPPQSGIFSLFLILSAFFSILTMYSRYLVVKDLTTDSFKEMTVLNSLALFGGLISTFGMILVACYPVTVEEVAHNIGAYTLFVCGVIYSCLQTRISFKMCPQFNGLRICWYRLALTMVSIIALAVVTTYDPIAKRIWTTNFHDHSKEFRHPGDEGFEEFLVASIGEWILAFSFILFFYTFIREFNKVYVQFKAVPMVNHFDEQLIGEKHSVTWQEKQPILVPYLTEPIKC